MPMAVAICSKFDCSYVVIGNAVAVAASLCMGALGAEVDTSSPGARCNRGAHDAPDLLPAPVADLLQSTYMAKSFLVPEAPPFRIAHWFVPAVIAVPWSHAGSTQFLERSAVAQGAPRASEHAPAPRCTSTLHRNDLSQVQSIVGLISRAAPCRGPMHHAPDYAPAHAPRTR